MCKLDPNNQSHAFLLKHGWQFIRYARLGKGNNRNVMLWDHPSHKHFKHEYFSLLEAVNHQKHLVETGECYCQEMLCANTGS